MFRLFLLFLIACLTLSCSHEEKRIYTWPIPQHAWDFFGGYETGAYWVYRHEGTGTQSKAVLEIKELNQQRYHYEITGIKGIAQTHRIGFALGETKESQGSIYSFVVRTEDRNEPSFGGGISLPRYYNEKFGVIDSLIIGNQVYKPVHWFRSYVRQDNSEYDTIYFSQPYGIIRFTINGEKFVADSAHMRPRS